MQRRYSRPVILGNVQVGGGAPVTVQSMTNTDTRDVRATLDQIHRLVREGCEIVRVAVPDLQAARALKEIKAGCPIPLVADIHFDYRLALAALESGADGLRINPGNIGGRERVAAIVNAARGKKVPIRIGVNAGSLEKDLLARYGGPTPQAMVESALRHIRLLEEMGYREIKVSLKASHVPVMIEAYRLLAREVEYPLHVGVTEAGTVRSGTIKSAVGIGALLAEGIGDTIRVSLTGDPVEEVRVGYAILKALGLRQRGIDLISCPTCGRTCIDLERIALEVEERLSWVDKPLKVAVMGCAVNGPGEASHADVGIAGGRGFGLLFRGGRIIGRFPEKDLVDALVREVEKILQEKKSSD
ncbi:flavodoxin-dependent (E)-4-hydroxy-3-methylbut-2-enyl-diphosphate synthase [Desulfofundulus thermocisternus]|uniref:flavodoxin-dependent (E)-4-hydroxy-3-methylbut-2-enyl-diphosphate synthase n=1 Tax=Desulfofundulus thermocisternus TaxID=42471 RepID=UPI0004810C35|nr:flavodoxin-dependent (E)-4-hydroxy-3-methylbut-2-enyl-diphosphate synthase [Desulfofundulus thermocisternus]MBE3585614.1 flavodoxin-dependent (E)-4-hydroxy-3-methylbut-2-enyl-diphosphate synthase [Thermoanaerobacter sp.]MCS5696114.1 flavodoxin-dependent (E)-4-hydroxy-3-methylbut-2-enyl-diphosphate synthase [Desulfofundulus thermocisternus]